MDPRIVSPVRQYGVKVTADVEPILIYSLLADLVVAIHLGYACFVLFGFLAVFLGILKRWTWTRNPPFRISHLACTALVAAEAAMGVTCPLTTLENNLLRTAGETGYDRSFIGNLMNNVLFYNAPESVFTTVYGPRGFHVYSCSAY